MSLEVRLLINLRRWASRSPPDNALTCREIWVMIKSTCKPAAKKSICLNRRQVILCSLENGHNLLPLHMCRRAARTSSLPKQQFWNWGANRGACLSVVPCTLRPRNIRMAGHPAVPGGISEDSPVHLDEQLAFVNKEKKEV